LHNGLVLAEVGDLEHKTVNPAQKHIEAEMLMISLMPPFWQTPVIISLSISRIINN